MPLPESLPVSEGQSASTPGVLPLTIVLLGGIASGKSTVAALVRQSDLPVVVSASPNTRRERARLRGWQEGELERREARQTSPEEKRAVADAVVDNDKGVLEAETDVERIWSSLVGPRIS